VTPAQGKREPERGSWACEEALSKPVPQNLLMTLWPITDEERLIEPIKAEMVVPTEDEATGVSDLSN
jgi:hypothetical protein